MCMVDDYENFAHHHYATLLNKRPGKMAGIDDLKTTINDGLLGFSEQVDKDVDLLQRFQRTPLREQQKYKTVSCTNCGGPTDEVYACEYCGT